MDENKIKLDKIRQDFPILNKVTFLDNAASSQKPLQIIDKISKFLKDSYANIHRGLYELSELATEKYEIARKKVANFIKARYDEVIFTKNTTESLNLLGKSLIEYIIKTKKKKKVNVLISIAEHHSNLLPWQTNKKVKVHYVYLKKDKKNNYSLNYNEIEKKLKGRTNQSIDIVSLASTSNVLGFNDIKVFNIVKEISPDTITIMDGAQYIPHTPFKINKNIDFLAFSGHKMLALTGIGILYGKKELLEEMPCFLTGGDMVNTVSKYNFIPAEVPRKFEAGTMPFVEAYSLGLAVEYLERIGMKKINSWTKKITQYAINNLRNIKNIKIISSNDATSLVSFIHKKYDIHDIAYYLARHNIAVRSGYHCAEPLHKHLGYKGSVRASFYFYNNFKDVDKLVQSLKKLE